ncbi:hypothetical protein BD779DRAFT_164411 [Infundibulicybe gibba]|nr:hypothetical protein BD779DRAFT_164411 [Infundibulicybe gibba]
MHSQIPKSLFAFILLIHVSNAVLMNQTIDDSLGDSLTGLKVQYCLATAHQCGGLRIRVITAPSPPTAREHMITHGVLIPAWARKMLRSCFPFGIVSTVDCNFLWMGDLLEAIPTSQMNHLSSNTTL